MDDSTFKPCPDAVRIERLAASDPQDLSLSEREELNRHIANCQQCATLYERRRNEYIQMDALIRGFPPDGLVPRLSLPPLKPRRSGVFSQFAGEQLIPSPAENGSSVRPSEEWLLDSSIPRQSTKEEDNGIRFSDLDIGGPRTVSTRSLVAGFLAVAAIVVAVFISILLLKASFSTQGSSDNKIPLTPIPTPISHNRTIQENKEFRCGSCGEPRVMVTLTKILIQGDQEHVVLYLRLTNDTTEGVGVMFTTIQFRDPDGNVISAIANGPPSLFIDAKASETLTVAFDLAPKPGVPYVLDLVLSKERAWDNIYQSENLTLSPRT